MNSLSEYWNNTNSFNIIMPLISLMSTHFLVNSFTLISDTETETKLTFLKIASKFHLKVNCNKPVRKSHILQEDDPKYDYAEGYIFMGKSYFKVSKIMKKKPNLIVAVYNVEENGPVVPNFFSKLVIPPIISFFVIPIPDFDQNNRPVMPIKCLRLYKPISNLTLKVFPTMSYEGLDNPQWNWENKKTNWNSFKNDVRNLEGVTVTIAMVSTLEEKFMVDSFWAGRNSFFWRAMVEHLRCRAVVNFRHMSQQKVNTSILVLRKMLWTNSDGLAVLPVITPDRGYHLGIVLIGIDQRYHLLVRTPQYVHSWQSIFKPLAHDSWICLALAILLISIMLRVATFREKSADLCSCFLTVFGFVCAQGCSNMPRNSSGCLVCYTALLFSIIIYQFYTSNFYSLLSTKEVSLPFTSLEDFLEKRTHKLFLHPDTAIYGDMMKAKNGTLRRVRELLQRDPDHQMRAINLKRVFHSVCDGSGAIFGFPYQTIHYTDVPCKFVPVDSGYFPGTIITAVRKNFPFMSQFKYVHWRYKEAGITEKFKREFFTIRQQHKTKADLINEPVTLVHVAFLFVFLASAVILSWVILGFEKMASSAIKSKKIF